MQKLDRLGWAAGVRFASYGLRVGVRVNVPEVPEEVFRCLPPGWAAGESPFVDLLYSLRVPQAKPGGRLRQYWLAYKGLQILSRTMDPAELWHALESDMQRHVAEHAHGRVFVHAGVVGWRGRAIVLPGRSYAGKSTLVRALLAAGATYYSDEYAVLDEAGLVHPYPRRLALRDGEAPLPRRVAPSDLGAATGSEPLPVGLVAVTKYQAGSPWRARPLPRGRTLVEVLNHAVPVLHKPVETLAFVEKALPGAGLFKGTRGEADEAAAALLRVAA